jgi:hypothetical protein
MDAARAALRETIARRQAETDRLGESTGDGG